MDIPERKTAVACVLLAAGSGTRFGGGKLLAEFDGKPLFERAMDALPDGAFVGTAVVSGDGDILAESLRRGFLAVRNDAPEEGVSRSIRLGLRAAEPCSAVLFLVGDQPLLTAGSVRRILAAGRENPDKIIVPQRPACSRRRFFRSFCCWRETAAGGASSAPIRRRFSPFPCRRRSLPTPIRKRNCAALQKHSFLKL